MRDYTRRFRGVGWPRGEYVTFEPPTADRPFVVMKLYHRGKVAGTYNSHPWVGLLDTPPGQPKAFKGFGEWEEIFPEVVVIGGEAPL